MSQKLHDKQRQAIDLLVSGMTVTAVADEIGVARETVSRWRSQEAAFIAEYTNTQAQIWEAQADTMRAAATKANQALVELLDHEDPNVRLKAIKLAQNGMSILPRDGRVHPKTKSSVERELSFSHY